MKLENIQIPNADKIYNNSVNKAYEEVGIYSNKPILESEIIDFNTEKNNNVYNLETNSIEMIEGGANYKKEKNEGIIEILKKKYMNEIKSLKQQLNNKKNKEQKGGAIGALGILVVVLKLTLMTIGTYIFKYFPMVFLIALMCLYIEYKLTIIMGLNIVGLPLFYMICAFCCPCCWTCFRLFKGWTNSLNVQTENLYNILGKCASATSVLDIYPIDGRVCKNAPCWTTSKRCHSALYRKPNTTG